MKILKTIKSYITFERTNYLVLGVFIGALVLAAVNFMKRDTLSNAVILILQTILVLAQLVFMQFSEVRDNQQGILRQLAKLRHPSQQKESIIVIRQDKLDADLAKLVAKPIKVFPETKNRDDINANLRQQFAVQFPQGGIIPQSFAGGSVINPDTSCANDPRMTAKVTGEFPGFGAYEPATGYEEMEKERTFAEAPADEAALTDEQWETIEKSGTGPNPQPEEMREPFAWPPKSDMNDYSLDSPHYGKPHEDCCK